ncbi:MAG TPA: glutathione S-transferase family protein [Gaiellales bacterium]|jgi:glutathione S-transferase
MQLYHQPRSRSARVLWLAEEAGAPIDVTMLAREHKQTDEYRALHPLGNSPVFVEEGGPVFESAALILHLADLHPEAGLIAAPGSHERGLQYQWAFFAMIELEGPLIELARQLWKDAGEPIAEVQEIALARYLRAAAVVEAALAGGDHLVGDGFSVADIVIGSVLSFARTSGVAEIPPGLVAYVDGLEARPARERAYTRTE